MKRYSNKFRRNRRGSYLALTMIVALALTAIGASFISVTTTASKSTEADFTEQNLVYVAETGIDQAISTLNRYLAKSSSDGENWTTPQPPDATLEWSGTSSSIFGSGGWTKIGDGYRKDFGILTLGNGRKARLRVVVRKVPTPDQMTLIPSIVAEVAYDPEGRLGNLGSRTYSRQFAILMRHSTRYPNSLLGIDGVTLGDAFTVDSYNSANGIFSTGTNRGDKALVATLSSKDGAIKGNSPVIYGYLATGGDNPTDNIGNDAHLFGVGSLPPYKNDSGPSKGVDPGRIVRDFSGAFPVATAPATTGVLNTGLLQTLPVSNGLLVLPAGSYRLTGPLKFPQTITHTTETVTEVTENVTTTVMDTVTEMLPLGPLGALIPVVSQVPRTVTTPVTRQVVTTSTNELTVTGISTLGDVTIVVDGAPGADPATVPTISLEGNSQLLLALNSTLRVYTPGNVDISNGGIGSGALDLLTATNTKPQNFRVYGTNTNTEDGKRQTIGIVGNGRYSGIIDAPNADIILRSGSVSNIPLADLAGSVGGVTMDADVELTLGNSTGFGFQGAIIGRHIASVGKFAFHYDEALGSLMFPSYTMDTWVELRGSNKVDMSAYGF